VADFDCGTRVGRFRPVDSMVPIGGISIELIVDFYSHFTIGFPRWTTSVIETVSFEG
jgi:hypothetical protein